MVQRSSVPLCVCPAEMLCFSILLWKTRGACTVCDSFHMHVGGVECTLGLVQKCRLDLIYLFWVIGLKALRSWNQGQGSGVKTPPLIPRLSHTWPPVKWLKRQEEMPVTVGGRGHGGQTGGVGVCLICIWMIWSCNLFCLPHVLISISCLQTDGNNNVHIFASCDWQVYHIYDFILMSVSKMSHKLL